MGRITQPIRNPDFPQSPRLPLYKEKLRNLTKLRKNFETSHSKAHFYTSFNKSISSWYSYHHLAAAWRAQTLSLMKSGCFGVSLRVPMVLLAYQRPVHDMLYLYPASGSISSVMSCGSIWEARFSTPCFTVTKYSASTDSG